MFMSYKFLVETFRRQAERRERQAKRVTAKPVAKAAAKSRKPTQQAAE